MDEPRYRVMTVCTGNICRSPIAEVVLRARFEDAGLGDVVEVDSTGISDEESGNPMDRRARAVLTDHGYDLPAHRARQARPDQLAERDLVLAMTSRHAAWLRRRAPSGTAERVRMYRSFDPAVAGSSPGAESALDIADPWYGGPEDFETTLAEVEAAADAVVEHVRAELAARRS